MKNLSYIATLFTILFLVNCKADDPTFGEIVTPTNVTITAEIVGKDTDNPYGDGSGFVNFTASADNAITYQFNFGDGKTGVNPSGTITNRFTQVGVNTYTVVVSAVGTGGVMSSTSIDVEVYSSFSDPEAANFLSGPTVGDSKTWYWAANIPLHVGLGPAEDDYGNGEYAFESWWNAIQPFDEEKSCMYADKFVFTNTTSGLTFQQTEGPAFVPGAYASNLGLDGDVCHEASVLPVNDMYGVKNVSMIPSESFAAINGTYNELPYRGTSFQIADDGFMGWYVGSSTYDIISISETEMHVRILQAGSPYSDGGYAWYARYQTQDPFTVDNFPTLIWSDEFDTDGAPDATKWTFDLGDNGWGNNEQQDYTSNSENVIIEDGKLKIHALSDGAGGYTSARLKTEGLFDFKYGKVEVRAKLPSAQGTWPAIWMLGTNFSTDGWPVCGEIDIMEQTGDNKNDVLATCHWFDTASASNASYGESTAITDPATEFHIYKLEWTEEAVKIFVDNTLYYTLTNASELPFNANFFVILNIAMGGTLGGTIDPNFTQDTMEVDYVRVYQ